MLEHSGRNNKQPDGLFLERLDTFMAKCLADIRAFSEREQRPFEETRQYVAEWHAKYLFQPKSSTTTATTADKTFPTTTNTDTINVATHWQTRIHSILCEASRVLESLYETSGIQSFLLAVDPPNPADNGFLGGSLLGREFWRSMRGGGKAGAKSFRVYCLKEMPPPAPLNQPLSIADATVPAIDSASSSSAPVPARRGVTAKSLKTELYDKFRKTLRRVSGVRNAEMKWTSPDRLDVYGVQLVGWPSDIPAQNPSTLKQGQNKRLMEALESGMIRFEKIGGNRRTESPHETPSVEENVQQVNIEPEDDFSWALDTDAGNVHVSDLVLQLRLILG
ncbi:hypothetical protein AMATHDRAFT_138738 [Amanita thiersii Skay4041]|uniref:Uncharacterized protein n=1 Tax=Amanita thiersii Skay4041 TaxID=703135 RepID=A0A2A9NSB8_9AGAR|nr:hypothetical protein AMATHDRAFT_138738 [Amanita thiersii Skay4041]